MNDVWHHAVIGFGYVNAKTLCVKLSFSRVSVCMVVVYGPL